MRGDTNFKGSVSSDPTVYSLYCDTVLVTTATITISNIFFLSQGSSHNNIVKLQSDNIRDKKIIFLVLDHLKLSGRSVRESIA